MEAVELLLGVGSSPRSASPRNGESQQQQQQYMDLLKACIISASHSQESFVQTVNIHLLLNSSLDVPIILSHHNCR